jgi:hypothetical protein
VSTTLPGPAGGFVFVSTDDADNRNHCDGVRCGGLYKNVLAKAVEFATYKATYLGAKSGILAIGINGNPALAGFQSW